MSQAPLNELTFHELLALTPLQLRGLAGAVQARQQVAIDKHARLTKYLVEINEARITKEGA